MNTFDAGDRTLYEVEENVWELEADEEMRVPARVLANEALLEHIGDDRTLDQLRNVSCMPGSWRPRSACPTATRATASPSAASPPSTPRKVASRPAASASTSTAASAW